MATERDEIVAGMIEELHRLGCRKVHPKDIAEALTECGIFERLAWADMAKSVMTIIMAELPTAPEELTEGQAAYKLGTVSGMVKALLGAAVHE